MVTIETLLAGAIAISVLGAIVRAVLNRHAARTIADAIQMALPDRTEIGRANQPAQPDDECAGPFDPEIEDLIEEINRLRAENAILSGAYQFVLYEANGHRQLVRFSLN
jgi:hypothetical protein